MAEALAARRGRARPKRAQPQCRLRDRLSDGRIVGRGATAPGGRPHAEAVALEQAGKRARGRDRLCDARTLRA